MTMFGGVPISVIIPPSIDAKDSGISDSDGLRCALRAACMSIGISSASAATLFIRADMAAASDAMIAMCAASLRVAETTNCASSSIAPEFDRPRLTISTSAMMMTAG